MPPHAENRKRKTERLEIARLGTQGDGIAETVQGPVYVPFSLPGDIVEAAIVAGPRGTRQARLERILAPGPERRTPPCRHFGTCGGCALQHLIPDAYRRWIVARLRTALGHHGFAAPPIRDPAISPPHSRRRLVLHAHRKKGSALLGFHQRRSHRLVDLADCPVARPWLLPLLAPLRGTLAQWATEGETLDLTLTETASGIDLRIDAARPAGLEERETLAALAAQNDLAAVHWSEAGALDPIAVRRPPVMMFGGVEVAFPPGAFVQATAAGERALQGAVDAWSGDAGRIADLFAGLGSLTLPQAVTRSLHAVEGAAALCDALRHALRRSRCTQASVAHRDLFREPLRAGELAAFDAVVFDPPRAGAKAQAAEIARSDVARVIAVSCNPNTFGRDARILADGGYRLAELRPVDQFLWSGQIELAALFLKGPAPGRAGGDSRAAAAAS